MILQSEASGCGLACVAMILEHHGSRRTPISPSWRYGTAGVPQRHSRHGSTGGRATLSRACGVGSADRDGLRKAGAVAARNGIECGCSRRQAQALRMGTRASLLAFRELIPCRVEAHALFQPCSGGNGRGQLPSPVAAVRSNQSVMVGCRRSRRIGRLRWSSPGSSR